MGCLSFPNPLASCPGFVVDGTYGDLAKIAKTTRKHKIT